MSHAKFRKSPPAEVYIVIGTSKLILIDHLHRLLHKLFQVLQLI